MQNWQIVISIIAGLVILDTFIERLTGKPILRWLYNKLKNRFQQTREIPPFEDPEKVVEGKKEFKEGLIYFDENEKTATYIREILQQKGAQYCLLSGPNSTRKTTFILALAISLKKTYSSYYFKVKDYDYEKLLQNIKPYDQENMLFIIDDCHNLPDVIGKFILDVTSYMKKAKFVFVCRDITYDNFEREEHNFFINEKIRKIPWFDEDTDLENTVKGVVRQFCKAKGFKNYENQIGEIGEIIKKCGKNFFLLNQFLETWEKTLREGNNIALSEIPIEKVYENFYQKYFTYGKTELKEKRNSLLMHLCAIYQFEIPISKEFLDKEGLGVYGSKDLEKCFKDLKREGVILSRGKNYFVLSQHPFFCEMFLKVAESYKELTTLDGKSMNREDFTVEICKKYLLRTKNLQLISGIFRNKELIIGKRIVEDQNSIMVIKDFLKKTKSFVTVGMLLRIFERFKIADNVRKAILGEDLLERFVENISKNSPKAFNCLLKGLYVFEPDKRISLIELLKRAGIEILIKSYKDNLSKVDIDTIYELMKNLGDKEMVEKTLLSLTKEEIKSIFSNSSEKRLYNFWINIELPKLPRQFTEAWSEYLSEKKDSILKWFSSKFTKLSEIGRYIRITYWHKELQPLYNKLLFITPYYLNKLKEANLEEIAQFIIDITSIKWRRNPLIGKILGLVIMNPIEHFPLNYKGFIFDTDTRFLLEKAKILIRQKRVSQINPILFSVQGFHGTYTVTIEENSIKCSCSGYESKKVCSHSIAILLLLLKNEFNNILEKKIKESSLRGVQKLLQVVDEMRRRDLADNIMHTIGSTQFDLIKKMREARLQDLNYLLWNMPSNFLPKYCDLLVKNINLVEKIEKAKIEEVIFLLWNLFEGNFLPEFIFNEKILLNFLKKEEKIGEKLALIGLIDYIKPELVEKLNYYYNNIKRKLADSEKEVKRWFIIRRKRRNKGLRVNFRRELFSTFLFLFGVRGLRKIEERYCFYIIRTLTPSFIKKLINQLKTEYERLKKMGKMNDKREKLYLDAIDWLNSYCLM